MGRGTRRTSKAGKATGRPARKRGELDTTVQPALGPRGVGRPRKLTREMMEDVCRLLAQGLSITQATAAAGIVRSQYYLWKEQGARDAEAGRRTIEAEFSDGVEIYEAVGAALLWKRVDAGTRVGKDAKRNRARVDAGKLALAAFNTRYLGRLEGRAAAPERDEAPTQAQPQVPVRRVFDLSRLSPEQQARFRELYGLATGETPAAPPAGDDGASRG